MHQWDPKFVKMVFNGLTISGYADGSFINVEYESDGYTSRVGADGEGVRSKSHDERATITLTLMPGSSSNAHLSSSYTVDRATPAGAGSKFPLKILDLSTGSSWEAPDGAWVKKPSGYDHQTEAQNKVWQIGVMRLIETHGAAL